MTNDKHKRNPPIPSLLAFDIGRPMAPSRSDDQVGLTTRKHGDCGRLECTMYEARCTNLIA